MIGPTARELRSRISVQRRTARAGSLGAPEWSWQTLIAARAAKLVPTTPRRRGEEEVIAARLQGTALFDAWLRWDSQTSQIRAGDQVTDLRDPTRVFHVRFAQDMDQRRRWILLQLEMGVAP